MYEVCMMRKTYFVIVPTSVSLRIHTGLGEVSTVGVTMVYRY